MAAEQFMLKNQTNLQLLLHNLTGWFLVSAGGVDDADFSVAMQDSEVTLLAVGYVWARILAPLGASAAMSQGGLLKEQPTGNRDPAIQHIETGFMNKSLGQVAPLTNT